MQFFTLLAVLAAPLVAVAQNSTSYGPNYFTLDSGFTATAGQPSTLKWTPTTGGTVTLVLRSGVSSNLNTGLVIQKGIANSGSYTWQVPTMITRGTDYALEIISDQDSSATNYYGPFVIDSTYTVTTSAGATTSNSLFSTLTLPTATSTLRSSTVSSSVTLLTGSATSTSTSSTASSTGTSATTSSTISGAGFQTTTSTRLNGAPHPTAMAGMAGMLGMVALGALAL